MALESFAAFADDDQLDTVVFERMLAGLATRRHRAANEPVGAASSSTSKSAVSRRFVRATARELDDLLTATLSALDVAVLMIDGIHLAGRNGGAYRQVCRQRTPPDARGK